MRPDNSFAAHCMRTSCKDLDIPVVVSALGSHVTLEAANILEGPDREIFIVAFDWEAAGRNGIERWVYFLGGLAEVQTPCETLKPVFNSISGFSLKQRRMNG